MTATVPTADEFAALEARGRRGRPPRGTTVEMRFWGYVSPEPNSGCWLWTGPCAKGGYGTIIVRGRPRVATHIALEFHGIVVPPGLKACHRCDVPACVNPEHIFIGTDKDNHDDMMAKGRFRPPTGPRNTPYRKFCKRGHPLTDDNVYVHAGKNGRRCRECANIIYPAIQRARNIAKGLRSDGKPRLQAEAVECP